MARPPVTVVANNSPPKGFAPKPKKPNGKAKKTVQTPTNQDENTLAVQRGRRELELLRQRAQVDPASERERKRQLTYTDEEMRPVDPTEGVMPQAIADRMLSRIIPFAAIPIFGAVLVFASFYYANTKLEMDLPPSIVAYSTQALLLLSFGGITWGVMSTSLDEEAEGSLLGVEEFKKNAANMRGDLAANKAIAEKEFVEDMAAEKGIIMNKRALDRAEPRKQSDDRTL